jgi:hypothetical protein
MKRIIYLIIGTFAILLTLFSCAPEEITGIDQSGVPKISEMQISITSNADRLVTFHLENEGVVPIWIFPKSTSTKNDYQTTYKAGNYTVEVKAYNRNGVSDGSVVKEFVVQ